MNPSTAASFVVPQGLDSPTLVKTTVVVPPSTPPTNETTLLVVGNPSTCPPPPSPLLRVVVPTEKVLENYDQHGLVPPPAPQMAMVFSFQSSHMDVDDLNCDDEEDDLFLWGSMPHSMDLLEVEDKSLMSHADIDDDDMDYDEHQQQQYADEHQQHASRLVNQHHQRSASLDFLLSKAGRGNLHNNTTATTTSQVSLLVLPHTDLPHQNARHESVVFSTPPSSPTVHHRSTHHHTAATTTTTTTTTTTAWLVFDNQNLGKGSTISNTMIPATVIALQECRTAPPQQ